MFRHMSALLVFLLAALLTPAISAFAHEYRQGDLVIGHPWARPTPGESKVGAAYLSIKNAGKAEDKLTGAKADIAERVEIHEHIHDAGGVMRMREVAGGLIAPAGETVEMKPGGYHIMLLGLKQRLEEGQSFPMTLNFARAGDMQVEVKIERAPTHDQKPAGEAHSHHHKH
jgi:hypothetical protein